jgi:hypothetical protein
MRIKTTLTRRLAGGLVALAAGAALAVGATSVAYAKGEYKYWNSSTNPLVVTGYGSWAKAYGQWRVADGSSGTRSWLDARVWYYNADNHKKYSKFETWVNAGICVAPQYTSCTAAYYYYAGAQTPHSNVAAAQWLYANTGVSPSGNYARARVWVCLDVPLRSDPCAGPTYTAGTAY